MPPGRAGRPPAPPWYRSPARICSIRALPASLPGTVHRTPATRPHHERGSKSAKTGLAGRRRQRAGRQTCPRLTLVVAAGGDVVRCFRVIERGEVLDLAAAGPELEHAAAVQLDHVAGAVVVEVEQLAEEAKARSLDVQGQGRERKTLDVGDRVNRRIPRDPLPVRPQDL